jgi:Flp pilus assembly protein TadD
MQGRKTGSKRLSAGAGVNPQYLCKRLGGLGRSLKWTGGSPRPGALLPKAAEQSPADPSIRFNLARMLIATQRYREAIAELQPAIAVDNPDRARFLFGLSTAHVLAGDIAEGRRYGMQALDLAKSRGQTDLAAAIQRNLEKLPQ